MGQKDTARLNLHESLERHGYDHGIVCTYTFDHEFFEDYCLDRLRAFSANGNLTVIVDQGTYEKAIGGPPSHRPRKANLRYLLHPVSVPGAFHGKMYLFASPSKGKLVIGSANCTRAGLTANAELAGVFVYEREKQEQAAPLLRAAFRVIQRIAERWPSQALASNLADMARGASWLLEEDGGEAGGVRLLDNLDRPLWEQMLELAPPGVNELRVVSRYFDATPAILDVIGKSPAGRKVSIFTQNGSTTLTPAWLDHPLFATRRALVMLCEYSDEGRPQALHGKALSLEGPEGGFLAFGSANFTSPALLRSAATGNFETMLTATGIPPGGIKDTIFAPLGRGTALLSPDMLRTAPRDPDEASAQRHQIQLLEAELKGSSVWLRIVVPDEHREDALKLRISFHDEAVAQIPLSPSDDDWLQVELDRDLLRRIGQASSVASVHAWRGEVEAASSNPLLIANLLDIGTGESVRKSRAVRQAEQSALQFSQALLDLLRENDPDQLLLFLTMCDIPVLGATRLATRRGGITLGAYDGAMRTLGERNLRVFADLHEAAMDFVDRHMRKLQRHVRDGSIEGAGNYLHIFLGIGSVLQMQIERATTGIEATRSPLAIDDWGTLRDRLSAYFERFRDLMRCLWAEYLPALCRLYQVGTVIEQFEPDLAPIRQLADNITRTRARVEQSRKASLRVLNPHRARIVPQYFTCVLSDKSWPGYVREIGDAMAGVDKVVTSGVTPWIAAKKAEPPPPWWKERRTGGPPY